MSTGKRNKTEMAPSFQKNRKNQDQKNEPIKTGDKAQPTAEQIRIAQIIDTKAEDPTLKEKIKQVMDATRRSEDEVLTALHDCDNDPDAAVDLILEGGHVGWSTSTSKKKSKPPVEKSKDASNQNNSNAKNSNNNAASPAGEGDDWNESDNADENSNVNRVNSIRGKGPANRPSRGGFSRPFNKRGGGRPNSTRESFGRSVDNNSEWSKGSFKPGRGRNFFKNNRTGSQKDNDNFINKEISERLGQNENNQEKHDSGGSDWASDTSDHNKNSNQNMFESKSGENKGDEYKWQDDSNYWGKSQSRGRGSMRSRNFNSYRQNEDGNDSRGFQNKGGRGRGRYPGSRSRGEGRGRWDDGGFRGRMSNGPSRGGWRGGRGGRSMNKPAIETWNPTPVKDEEDWDQEEEIFTGVETKVFTPSSAAAPTVPAAVITEPPKLMQDPTPKEERTLVSSSAEPVATSNTLTTAGQQFLAQLTNAAANVPKSIPQSVFNDVHFKKTEITTSEYGGSFGLNTYSETETSNESKQQVPRARLPPPSKIPSSAVEMPPEVGSGITLLDVQFGALELEQPSETAPPAAPPSPSPPPPAEVPAPPPASVSNDMPVYQRPAIQDLLAKSEPPPSSTYYQDSYQTQYPKTTHQAYSSSYTQPSYNTSQSIYSAGLGSNSLTNPYQTYSGQVNRHSALTSTTNSKDMDMPTPSVNISPPSAKPKVVPVPPGVGPPALVNPQYIVNQPYIQQPFYSLEDIQLLQGGRLPQIPGYYDVSYPNPPSSAPREFDTRFQTQDTSTSPAPPNPTPSQNQTLMNPHIPYFAYYGGSMIGKLYLFLLIRYLYILFEFSRLIILKTH